MMVTARGTKAAWRECFEERHMVLLLFIGLVAFLLDF